MLQFQLLCLHKYRIALTNQMLIKAFFTELFWEGKIRSWWCRNPIHHAERLSSIYNVVL